eukprot:SAG11_NODE_1594_length_4612_cov_11.187458_4_plen_177_part_00
MHDPALDDAVGLSLDTHRPLVPRSSGAKTNSELRRSRSIRLKEVATDAINYTNYGGHYHFKTGRAKDRHSPAKLAAVAATRETSVAVQRTASPTLPKPRHTPPGGGGRFVGKGTHISYQPCHSGPTCNDSASSPTRRHRSVGAAKLLPKLPATLFNHQSAPTFGRMREEIRPPIPY